MKQPTPTCSSCRHQHLSLRGEKLCARKGVPHRKDPATCTSIEVTVDA
jgi:hypothetical protein